MKGIICVLSLIVLALISASLAQNQDDIRFQNGGVNPGDKDPDTLIYRAVYYYAGNHEFDSINGEGYVSYNYFYVSSAPSLPISFFLLSSLLALVL